MWWLGIAYVLLYGGAIVAIWALESWVGPLSPSLVITVLVVAAVVCAASMAGIEALKDAPVGSRRDRLQGLLVRVWQGSGLLALVALGLLVLTFLGGGFVAISR